MSFNDESYRNAVLGRAERLRVERESTSEFDQVFEDLEAPEYPATCDQCGEVGTNAEMMGHECASQYQCDACGKPSPKDEVRGGNFSAGVEGLFCHECRHGKGCKCTGNEPPALRAGERDVDERWETGPPISHGGILQREVRRAGIDPFKGGHVCTAAARDAEHIVMCHNRHYPLDFAGAERMVTEHNAALTEKAT